jgi:hypothetical protein
MWPSLQATQRARLQPEDAMLRRVFMTSTLAALALPAAAQTASAPPAQGLALRPIEPENALERAFVAALGNDEMRPVFRRLLLESPVALALASSAENAPPMEQPLREGATTGFVFTSAARLSSIFGEQTPRAVIAGRAALQRLRGKYVVINFRLAPMLTLEPEDVARYLETPE